MRQVELHKRLDKLQGFKTSDEELAEILNALKICKGLFKDKSDMYRELVLNFARKVNSGIELGNIIYAKSK